MKKNIVPDWKLERYLLGELPADELEDIRILEDMHDDVWEKLEALRAENEAILERYPPETIGRKIEKKVVVDRDGVSKRSVVAHWYREAGIKAVVPVWAVPAVVCVAALLIVPIRTIFPTVVAQTQCGAGEDRIKGTTQSIEVWRKNGAAAERLPQEAVAHSGDIVQLRYNVPESCYGALISVDGRGEVTVHLSGESGKAAPLTPGRPVALGNSYQLDDAPLFETFYLVTAKNIFDVESVTKPLKAANHPINQMKKQNLPGDQQVTAFTLRKEGLPGVNYQ